MATSRKKIEWGEVTASTDGSFSDTCTDRRTTDILYVASTTEGMGGSLDDLTLPDGFVLSEEGATTSPVDTAGDIAPADEVEGTEESSTTPSIDVGQGSTTPLTTDAASNTPPSIDETTATTTLQDDASSTATDLLETLLEEEFDSLQEPIDPTLPESAIKMMKLKTATPTPSMTELWEQAQKAEHVPTRLQFMREACAVATQAAPYIHARITSVNASTRKVTSIKDLSDEELLALAASAGAEESEEVVGEGAELVH